MTVERSFEPARPPTAPRGQKMVLFGIDDAYFASVAEALITDGAELHTIVGYRPQLLTSKAFTGVAIIDSRKFYRQKSALGLVQQAPEPLSPEVLAKFAPVENTFLLMTDRLSFVAQPVRARIDVFRALLRYWLAYFSRETSVGTAFFICAPHMGNDFVAFHAAKHCGVRTLFLERSLIHNRVLLLEDYDKFEKVLPSAFDDEPLERIEAAVDPAVLSTFRKGSSWSRHSAAINTAVVSNRTKKKSASRFTSVRLTSLVSPNKWARVLGRPFVDSEESAFFFGQPMPRYRETLHLFQYGRRVRHLRDMYQAMTKPPESGPYVFYAMHLQPERTTCPQGGVFDDQLLAIETLARALPDGYRLYVKEHPRQFWPTTLKARHFRNAAYYERLGALPNVHLLPLETETATMIRSAVATATVTGSAGWESLLAGKPSLVFGVPWYIPCNSCHAVRSVDDCRRAIAASLTATEESVQRDLLLYLLHFQARMIHATNMHRFVSSSDDYATLVQNLARAIAARAGLAATPGPVARP